MGIMMTSSLHEYTRNMKMSTNWSLKKRTGNYMQKGQATAISKNNPVYSEFERYREQLEKMREQNDPDRVAIYAKLESGKKLSPEELEYLRNNDPAAYQKAKEIEAEKENYKQALKRCRTKEDVERFHTTYVATRAAVANSIANNPNIPKLQKMGLLMHEKAKLQALTEETKAFKASSRYANMPTDAELKAELEENAEALRGETEETKPVEPTDSDEAEPVEPTEPIEMEPVKSTDDAESAGHADKTESSAALSQLDKPDTKHSVEKKPNTTYTSAHQADLKAETMDFRFDTAYGREIYRRETEIQTEFKSVFRGHKKA